MPNPAIEKIVALLADEHPPEEALREHLQTVANDAEALAALREAWPTQRLPIAGDYFSVERLGFGAAGVVYKAVCLAVTPRFVALKMLRLVAQEQTERFLEREVQILRALDCPGVSRYLDAGQVGGTHYLAMELVRGVPLDRYLDRPELTLEDKLVVFRKACLAVAEIHERGVIHRDLKPGHILVSEAGEPTLVDFGLSAAHSEDWATQIRKTQTTAGRIMGTVRYMSPEQAWAGLIPIDHRSDLWSLGVMLYEIATDGDYPYDLQPLEGMNPADSLVHRLQSESPRRPHIAAPQLAPALATLIERCLAFEPRRRVASARTLAEDLQRAVEAQAIRTRPLPLTYRAWRIAVGLALSSRVALWALTVFAVLLGLTFVSGVMRVGYRAWDDGLSVETRKRLLMGEARYGPLDFMIVGLGDEAYRAVPEAAPELGIQQVTADARTWRAVHGLLMECLAAAGPRAVVWDVAFQTPQPHDPAFVHGVQALAAKGIPVAVAAAAYDKDAAPALSPGIAEPLADVLHYGLIVARDQTAAPGEFVCAVKRGDTTFPWLALSAFAATCYPQARPELQLEGLQRSLRIRYRKAGSESYLREVDVLGLSQVVTQLDDELALRDGDVFGIKAFTLTPLAYWQQRTTAYEKLLAADVDQLRAWAAGRIVVFADTREPQLWARVDRHAVRYTEGQVENVPGGYLLADAIKGMFSREFRALQFPLDKYSFGVALGLAVVGCLAGVPLARRSVLQTQSAEWVALASGTLGAIACVIALPQLEDRQAVELALAGAALCAALAVSLWIEFTRRRILHPTQRSLVSE